MQRASIYLLLAFVCVTAQSAEAADDGWTELLDSELSKWEVYLGVPHKSVEVPGHEPSTSEDGVEGTPIGLADPLNVFRVEMISGEPVLKISGQVYGGLTSLEEYESYHLQLQFRWGEKKWPPRMQKKRDSGLLIHCVGQHGAFWNVWLRSLECQIQEGDCGDFIPLAGSAASVPVKFVGKKREPVYDLQSPLANNIGYIAHSPSEEKPHGEWNTIEVYTIGQQAVFIVNGQPNMALFNTRERKNGGTVPLTRGRLQIQSEAAEIEYRRIKLRHINEFPASLAEHVKLPAT